MRKRLNRLLDDALSLHSGRRSSDDYDDGIEEGARFKGEDSMSYSFNQTEIMNIKRRSQSAITR